MRTKRAFSNRRIGQQAPMRYSCRKELSRDRVANSGDGVDRYGIPLTLRTPDQHVFIHRRRFCLDGFPVGGIHCFLFLGSLALRLAASVFFLDLTLPPLRPRSAAAWLVLDFTNTRYTQPLG